MIQEDISNEMFMKNRARILLALVLFVVAGCGSSGPPAQPLQFEEFTIGMSLGDIDTELKNRKWVNMGTTTYASVVRYDLHVLGQRPPHLADIWRVELTTVDSTLVGIDVVRSAGSFSTLKENMKSLEEKLSLKYGEPHREKGIDELQRSEISGPEPVTLAVWRVDPPHRLVAMAVHETMGKPVGLVNYVFMDKDLQKKTR